MPSETFYTNYSKAWEAYQRSEGFIKLVKNLEDKGIKYPYSNNILRVAFDAGWKATGTKIVKI